MYWPGDSKNKYIRKRWLSMKGIRDIWKEEILCAYYSNISVCCIVWYLFTVYSCLYTRMDIVILPLMFGADGWEEFCKLDYYRCPVCRLRGKKIKVLWWERNE